MSALDDFLRRAWAERRARVAAQDAECARIDRDIDAGEWDALAHDVAALHTDITEHRQPDYAEQLLFIAERESASRALADAVAQVRFAASLTSADRDWLTREGVAL